MSKTVFKNPIVRAETQFKDLVRRIHSEMGEYPSERVINQVRGAEHRKDLNGRECRWRREVFAELGIELRGWNGFKGAQSAPDFSAVNDQTEVR